MRFTAGVFFGIIVVRPVMSRLYEPFRPAVEERLTGVAMDLSYAVVDRIRRRVNNFVDNTDNPRRSD